MTYARQLYQQYETLQEKYLGGKVKKKFGVSAQHYSFAVKAFVNTVKEFDTFEYEFAVYETKTPEVINDVASMKKVKSVCCILVTSTDRLSLRFCKQIIWSFIISLTAESMSTFGKNIPLQAVKNNF